MLAYRLLGLNEQTQFWFSIKLILLTTYRFQVTKVLVWMSFCLVTGFAFDADLQLYLHFLFDYCPGRPAIFSQYQHLNILALLCHHEFSVFTSTDVQSVTDSAVLSFVSTLVVILHWANRLLHCIYIQEFFSVVVQLTYVFMLALVAHPTLIKKFLVWSLALSAGRHLCHPPLT